VKAVNMSEFIRLQKFIASAGIASRRSAEELIASGRVRVNGIVVREQGKKIDLERDKVEVNGSAVKMAEKKYFLLYKPKGCLTTVRDPFGRPTVMDFFPPAIKEGLFPVGRLDMNTEGLLLLTNDGEMAFCLTHPRFKIEKKYLAAVKGIPSAADLLRFEEGIALEEGMTLPAKVRIVSAEKERALLHIVLFEGKKRQIRRMCQLIGHPVVSLKRVSYSFLNLKGLRPGDYRALSAEEIGRLQKMVGLAR